MGRIQPPNHCMVSVPTRTRESWNQPGQCPLLRWQAVVDEGTMMIVPEAYPHDGKTKESYHPLLIRGRVVAENTA